MTDECWSNTHIIRLYHVETNQHENMHQRKKQHVTNSFQVLKGT